MVRRRNPYTDSRPAGWSTMTKLQRGAWNRAHWSKDGASAPLSFEKRAAARRLRMALGRDNPKRDGSPTRGERRAARRAGRAQSPNQHGSKPPKREFFEDGEETLESEMRYRDWLLANGKIKARRNPRISFKTCHGKKVSFKAAHKRRGRVPKHLKPYLFKKGHRPKNRCGKRRSRR